MFDLARFLPYHVNRTGVRLAIAFGDDLERYGLTITMWRVLAVCKFACNNDPLRGGFRVQ